MTEVLKHNLSLGEDFLHTDYDHDECYCRDLSAYAGFAVPRRSAAAGGLQDGGTCFACGGLTVRTGTCTTCTQCGETGGCG
jgi:hypothetical protein